MPRTIVTKFTRRKRKNLQFPFRYSLVMGKMMQRNSVMRKDTDKRKEWNFPKYIERLVTSLIHKFGSAIQFTTA